MNKKLPYTLSRAALTLLLMLMMTLTASAATITLNSQTGEVTLQNGDVLTGTGGANTHVTIADGATVTLSGVNITLIDNSFNSYSWAGLTCLGDAVIILDAGTTNDVMGDLDSPGIYVPVGKTLTIQGSGTLNATGGNYAAGIGGGSNKSCGNITISGGIVTANGGNSGAGIGSGYSSYEYGDDQSSCGNITISGGTVTANGGNYAAGIGSGRGDGDDDGYGRSICGTVTISGGNVTATGGNSGAGIGSGRGSGGGDEDGHYGQTSCGTVTISGGTVIATGGNFAAGIGSGRGDGDENTNGYSSCNSVIISGGTVTANGGQNGAGIGSGYKYSSCGNITITDDVTNVTASKGTNNNHTIGKGSSGGTCGTITIGCVTTGFITQSPFTTFPYTVGFDANGGIGTMADMNFMYNVAQNLTPNTFTNPGKPFEGWSTSPNGPKVYNDGQRVSNLTETAGTTVTLYAKWTPVVTLTSQSGDMQLQDIVILTGTGGPDTHVTIADGATVILRGVHITAISNNASHYWAGITCLGDAVIILDEGTTNDVTGGYRSSGIQVPAGKTLTIQGSGTLNATGSEYAAGIGGSYESSCGNITISSGTVTATKGGNCDNAIGAGNGGTCGTVTIGSVVTGPITQSPFTTFPYTVSFDANGGTGTMANMNFMYNVAQNLTPNNFTNPGIPFEGWSTSPNGPKVYNDGQSVSNLTETAGTTVTLYAKWVSVITLTSQSGEVQLQDVVVLTGMGGPDTHVTIADGATVILNGVNITTIANNANHRWPGITCLGDAVIILDEGTTNNVSGGYRSSGIQVPAGKTLTIQGSGTLNATGSEYAAGIGGSYESSCGNITISSGIVTATKGDNCDNAIGAGNGGTCGTITIGSVVIGPITQSPFTTFPYTVRFNANGGIGTMADMNFMYNVTQNLTPNSFTHSQGLFDGWSTSSNGPKVFDDGQSVSNLTETVGATVKLYAKWTWIPTVVTLTTESGAVLLQNGDVLTGTGGPDTHVTIADSAMVTFSGVNITAIFEDYNHEWAGITCLGDAIIVLDEGTTNDVKGGDLCSGIYVPSGKTLTIQGSGTLNATGGFFSAGIGGGYESSCGNITINGGTVNATGDEAGAAGIGSGSADAFETSICGNITITGGTVTAHGGGDAAGIGSGRGDGDEDDYGQSLCGNITISGGIVIATGGDDAAGIGSGGGANGYSSCGNITISGGTITAYGGSEAAGIGGGSNFEGHSTCGDIAITNGVTMVTAIRGENCNNAIGIGKYDSSCGTVTIGDVMTGFITGSPFTTFPYTVSFNANGGTGTMTNQSFMYGVAKSLTSNGFNHTFFTFEGWATSPDGEKVYDDGQSVSNLTQTPGDTVTLYAKWTLSAVILTPESGDVELQNGNVLTGTGGRNTHVTIADGATVTLYGVNITAIPNNENYQWPGITCLGDAVIILVEDTINLVNGGYRCSGIYVPANKTLTIRGGGTLTTYGGDYAAGIGSNYYNSSCGNIIISGGTINAYGGGQGYYGALLSGAGIGTGHFRTSCGDITINGGTVNAYGGEQSAGIGTGYDRSTCGNITITDGVTSVTATKGNDCDNAIGAGKNSSCGTVTIGSVTTGFITQSPFTTYPYTVSFDANGGTGTMADMSFMYNVAQNLPANSFTLTDFVLDGWATSPDGEKVYNDEQSVINLTETANDTVTLYALWKDPLVIGSGNGTNHSLPLNNQFNYSLSQQIYTVAELGEAGLIESIGFYKIGTVGCNRDIDIYMKYTDKNAFESQTDWIPVAATDRVFHGTVNFVHDDWTVITLDDGFLYDGLHNVVLVVDDNTCNEGGQTLFKAFTKEQYQAICSYTDDLNANFDPTAPSIAGLTTANKNQLRVIKTELSNCMKPQHLSAIEVTSTTATLSWNEISNATAWQIMLNDDEENLITANENPFTLTGLIPYSVYTAKVRSACGSDWSNPLNFVTTNSFVIGVGDGNNNNVPLHNNYNYSLTQQVYTVEELGEAGFIESIGFFKNSTVECTRNIDIYMASTDKSAFESVSDWITVTEFDRVFSGTVSFTDNDWTDITLDESFLYDGLHNVVLIVDDNTGSRKGNTVFKTFSTEQAQAICEADMNDNYDPTEPSGNADYTMANKNVLRVLKSPPTDCMKPVLLAATTVTARAATLAWTQVGEVNAWQIMLNDDESNLIAANGNPFTLTGLVPETAYTVQVRSACGSEWSHPVSFTTPEACPAPIDLTCANVGSTTATLSWTETGEATAWQIMLNNDESNLINANWNPFMLTHLVPETTYTVRVRSNCDADGYSEWSNAVSFTPTDVFYIGSYDYPDNALPLSSDYNYSLTQQVYTVEELGEAGLIKSIGFYMLDHYTCNRNIDIYMVHTDKTVFNTTSDWIPVAATDRVFSGTVNFTYNGWTVITLDHGFLYDGVHNVVLVVDDNTGICQNGNSFKAYNAGSPQSLCSYHDDINLNPTGTLNNANILSPYKNQLRITKEDHIHELMVQFAAGWNWWAPALGFDLDTIQNALGNNLQGLLTEDGASITDLVPGQMYKIKTNAAVEGVRLLGILYDNVGVTITLGSNWFGYTGATSKAIAEVFDSAFGPVTGDKLVSQEGGFAIFTSNGWEGTLTHLVPGQGYVYFSKDTAPKTLTF